MMNDHDDGNVKSSSILCRSRVSELRVVLYIKPRGRNFYGRKKPAKISYSIHWKKALGSNCNVFSEKKGC